MSVHPSPTPVRETPPTVCDRCHKPVRMWWEVDDGGTRLCGSCFGVERPLRAAFAGVEPESYLARVRDHAEAVSQPDLVNHPPHYTTGKIEARFLAKVAKSDGCWIWTGAVASHGYGCIRVDGHTLSAHRVAYELWNGPIAPGLYVLHRCDVPLCVNPAHLFAGTAAQNTQDCVRKGRMRRAGEYNGRAKLTAAEVRRMRERFAAGGVTKKALAIEYGITPTMAGFILNGQSWVGA